MLREWDKLPEYMKTEEVRPYYESLKKKKISLALKRGFDVFAATVMLVISSPAFAVISIMIRKDSEEAYFIVRNGLHSTEENSKYLSFVQW